LGVITGYLRGQGVEVDPYDLNIDLKRLAAKLDKKALRPFYDGRAVIDFLDGAENHFFNAFIADLLANKDLRQYDAVGISCGADFSWLEIHLAFLLGKYIQRRYAKPIVFGGNNVAYLLLFKDTFRVLWESVLRNFHFVITGPGEVAFYRILQRLGPNVVEQPTEKINGLVYLDHRGDIASFPEQLPLVIKPDFRGLELDQYVHHIGVHQKDALNGAAVEKQSRTQIFKWPPYLALYANDVYARRQGPTVIERLIIPYVFNYNCPYNCAFCSQSAETRQHVILGDVIQVVNDIEALIHEYSTNYFYFFNNAFNYSTKFVIQFCEEVMRRGLKFNWSDCARFNNVDFELLQRMREAGCQKLVFGLETASPKILKLIDKRLDLAQVKQVLAWCHALGIWPDLEIIVGLPHESEEDFRETCYFIQENSEFINYMNINVYFIVPDSLIGRYPERYGIEILREPNAYERLLEANSRWLSSGLDLSYRPQNFSVHKFNEVNGSTAQDITAANHRKVAAMNRLQRREFSEVWHVLTILDPERKKN